MKVAVENRLYYTANGHRPSMVYASTPTSLYAQIRAIADREPRDCMLFTIVVTTPIKVGLVRLYRVAFTDTWAIDPDDFESLIGCDIDTTISDYKASLIG